MVGSVLDNRQNRHGHVSPGKGYQYGKKKTSPKKKQPPGITPKLSSAKFAAVEVLSSQNLMRPTSSRVGGFLPNNENIQMAQDYHNQQHSYLPHVPRDQISVQQHRDDPQKSIDYPI